MGCSSSKQNKIKKCNASSDSNEKLSSPINKTVSAEIPHVKGQYIFNLPLAEETLKRLPEGDSITSVTNFLYENGITYTGQVKGAKRHGKGCLKWPDGAMYDGDWVDDKASGYGVFQHGEANKGVVYEGEWKDNAAEGKGKLTQKDHVLYEGTWHQDIQEGEGKETWPDGSMFVGNYKNGYKEGLGTFTWPEKSKYHGEFHLNEIQGWGRYDWPDGRVYCGQWLESKMHGFGWFFWPNGQIYRGNYEMDKKEGWGEFFWPDKKMYCGWWENGKQSGYGTFRSPKGEERFGVWENGSRLNWISPEEYTRKVEAGEIRPKPEFPELPDWLEQLKQEILPEWYKS